MKRIPGQKRTRCVGGIDEKHLFMSSTQCPSLSETKSISTKEVINYPIPYTIQSW